MRKVYDISHILTQGAVERRVIQVYDDDSVAVEAIGFLNNRKLLRASEVEFSLQAVQRRFADAKMAKIRSLQRQIEKLTAREECKTISIRRQNNEGVDGFYW